MVVPEGAELEGEVGRDRPLQTHVSVAPGRGVQAAQVVAADEGHPTVHHQQLAVIQGVAPGIEQVPGPADGTVIQDLDRRREALEGARDDQIGKAVEDDVHGDALLGLARQVLLERLANGIALPDERLQIDSLLRGVDGGEHGVVELAAVAVDPEVVLADAGRRELRVRKALGLSPPLEPGDDAQHDQDGGLQGRSSHHGSD